MPDEVILIAAVTVDGFIARHNQEIINWSEDLYLFKEQTFGCPVIMGTNTYQTLSKDLFGREMIVVNRKDDPKKTLNKIQKKKCFIIGGGKTYFRFAPFLTHLYITPHPYVFGKGIPLFSGDSLKEIKIVFKGLIEVDRANGIFQYQYCVQKA